MRDAALLDLLIGEDQSVLDMDDAVGVLGNIGLMRDEDDGFALRQI